MKTTEQVLASITDAGRFEKLATAVLREADPICYSLLHPGVNAEGKTIKSPVDGICFVPDSNPAHIVAVHHTIAARGDLEKKWLYDPSVRRGRKNSKSTTPVGDLVKTAKLVATERKSIPNIRATLILTTNEEPDQTLVRSVETAGRNHGLEIRIWSRSRLSHFLDNNPTGQWLRYKYLHIEQELLSRELLLDLSKKSLIHHTPPDDPNAWIPRELDTKLTTKPHQGVTFLVAGSGLGKSVACYRKLTVHLENGGLGLVLPHETIASEMTLEQAVNKTLRQLHPSLNTVSRSATTFCDSNHPLLLIVEDVNRSGQAHRLVEKLATWGDALGKDPEGGSSKMELICPLWPDVVSSLGDQVKKRIEPLLIMAGGFSETEGQNAVLLRARKQDHQLSSLSALNISRALGHDPLLIALHDYSNAANGHQVIEQFVESSLNRVSEQHKDHSTAEYRQALRALAGEMLSNRKVELEWQELNQWPRVQGVPLSLVNQLAHNAELLRFTGTSASQKIVFRHDRVRDWLLADAAADLFRQNVLPSDVLQEPFFAEILGSALVWMHPTSTFLKSLAEFNPLALFHALRLLGASDSPIRVELLQAINNWLNNPVTHERTHCYLRWEALAMLAETDSTAVPDLTRKFHDRSDTALAARFRNGEVSGGLELCYRFSPGIGYHWRDLQIEHAKLFYGDKLLPVLEETFCKENLDGQTRVGLLRLAGYLADPRLAPAIETCWLNDSDRKNNLGEYLWAFAECCGDEPKRFLEPVCNAWGSLPDASVDEGGETSPRNALAAHELRWAFQKMVPVNAIDYFVERASQSDLRWPITFMLHAIDHPSAVVFIAREDAEELRQGHSSSFCLFGSNEWQRAQENGCPMSKVSRNALMDLVKDNSRDKYLKQSALRIWSATQGSDDLNILRSIESSGDIADNILRARLTRGDQQAIPLFIEKLSLDDNGSWWQFGRYTWSAEVTKALDRHLMRRSSRVKMEWGQAQESDWIVREMIMKLPENIAEEILLKYWDCLRFSSNFVQAALYICTPHLVTVAQSAIAECPKPPDLLRHISIHFGIRTKGCPGLTKEAQVRALAPYLHHLSQADILIFSNECSDKGWVALRQELLDGLTEPSQRADILDSKKVEGELDEMAAGNRIYWIGHWVEQFLKTGTPWSKILASMAEWVDRRRSFDALQVVAAAIVHLGTRQDLSILDKFMDIPGPEIGQLITDTKFAVRRRSIY